MTLFTLQDDTLDGPIRGSRSLGRETTLRTALGNDPTLVVFVRHFG